MCSPWEEFNTRVMNCLCSKTLPMLQNTHVKLSRRAINTTRYFHHQCDSLQGGMATVSS